ncbi:hypothetical protein [Streptomyces lacrimifluminis]|uniref:hypothetical protein n=1 Tax=Streptomyces lacrimifluminis TaxID=1500077 RepID=UPI00166F43A3|nr:hypothetical protein [Streptomyces lacrimifluminis]
MVDTSHPLADITAAHQAFEPGGGVGKHVIAESAGAWGSGSMAVGRCEMWTPLDPPSPGP